MAHKPGDGEHLNKSIDTPILQDAPLEVQAINNVIEIGLTGSIGSGKSTVSAQLRELGAAVIDADEIVRKLQQPGTEVYKQTVERFGQEVLKSNGQIDRSALAAIVFSDPNELQILNNITHPSVYEEISKQRDSLAETHQIIIHDVPLLIEKLEESGRQLDAIVVVDTHPETAIERLIQYRGYERCQAQKRLAAQIQREQRLARADYVINNNSTLKELRRNVEQVWSLILSEFL